MKKILALMMVLFVGCGAWAECPPPRPPQTPPHAGRVENRPKPPAPTNGPRGRGRAEHHPQPASNSTTISIFSSSEADRVYERNRDADEKCREKPTNWRAKWTAFLNQLRREKPKPSPISTYSNIGD